MRIVGIALALIVLMLVTASGTHAQKRVALIVGNGAYTKVPTLENPKNDATAMEAMFKGAGFDVVVRLNDVGVAAMRRALRDFSDTAQDADIAVVFYAGHGIEVGGVNYLIPTDAVLERDTDAQDEAVPLDRISQALGSVKRLRLVILDACRDNPFVRSMRRTLATRTIRGGYGEIDEKSLPPDTLIAYAQRAGGTAEDGTGNNSPYTTALLRHLPVPDLDIELALRRVRDDVLKATKNRQEPYKYGSLGGGELPLVTKAAGELRGDPKIVSGLTTQDIWALAFSGDGSRLAWGNTRNRNVQNDWGDLQFEIGLPSPRRAMTSPRPLNGSPSAFAKPLTKSGTYELIGSGTGLGLKEGTRTIAIHVEPKGFRHYAFAFTPDAKKVLSAEANGVLASIEVLHGGRTSFVGHEGHVHALAVHPHGSLVASGGADKTINLWNVSTGELIAKFAHGADNEWAMWTRHGYYSGSRGAETQIIWEIATSGTPVYATADELRPYFNRPDIIDNALILASADQAVREASGTAFKIADLLARPLPKFRIVSPLSGENLRGGRTDLRIASEAVQDPIRSVRILVNSRLVAYLSPNDSVGFRPGPGEFDIPLSKGRNDVQITLSNSVGEKSDSVILNHEGEGKLDARGALYILAIGIDEYPGLRNMCTAGGGSCDLKYASADARLVVAAAEKALGAAYTQVVKRVLVTGGPVADAPTAHNILDAVDLLKQATEIDTTLVYIAGHAYNDGPSYKLLATNAERMGDSFRGSTVVPWSFIQDAVERARGRTILFLDTARSGNAYNQRLGNAVYHAKNIIAYTAARFDQEALEDVGIGHGLFAYAVAEGLEGKARPPSSRTISGKNLADYIVKRVDELAKRLKSEQEPQYFKGRDVEDYILAQ